MALGAVPLTILTAHIDRKRLMVLSLSGYVLSNLVVAIAPTFVPCLRGADDWRGGACAAHVHRLGLCGAPGAAGHDGRAISFVYGGTSLGAVLGVPGMAAAGQLVGWRMAMFILTGLSLVLTLCIAFFLPPVSTPVHVRESLPAMRSRRVMRIFMVVVVVDGVFFIAHNLLYTYVTPLLLDHGVAAGALSLALLLTGGISILGLWGAGHLVDRNPAMGVLAGDWPCWWAWG
ncbi:MFS transporter [Komagataeibacter rhaeticus]|nr:MFS transporter [Komagataeibacter rhaeticus]